jgi:exocyst complex component 3
MSLEADLVAEATESAIQRLSDILRHPDDLTNKLPLVRKKITLERAAVEAQLKLAIEAQLDNASKGLDALNRSKMETLTIKETLIATDSLCANAQNTIKNYNHIKKVRFRARSDVVSRAIILTRRV